MDHTPNYPTDQEIWKDIPGFEGYYQASSFGQVRSLDRIVPLKDGRTRFAQGRILRPGITTNYLSVSLCISAIEKSFLIHYLVMLTFAGPRPAGYEINHQDGDKSNNSFANLEYVTTSQNKYHAFANGLSPKGSAHKNAKLNETAVREIRQLIAEGFAEQQIAGRYGVTRNVIWRIKHGKGWKHVQ